MRQLNERPGPAVQPSAGGRSSEAWASDVPIRPLPEFVDDRFPDPEPRVAAFLLPAKLNLRELHTRLLKLGCPAAMWQGQVLMCGSCEDIAQQRCGAVFLPDGCVVCWHTSPAAERRILELAAGSLAIAKPGPARLGAAPTLRGTGGAEAGGAPAAEVALEGELVTESLQVAEASGQTTSLGTNDGILYLTTRAESRTSHQLGLSLGLAVAVRLEALERRIEQRLEADWRDMRAAIKSPIGILTSEVSDRIFEAENGLHELRYDLNSEAGLLDAPDLLWEYARTENLYDQVVAHFDVRRRTALLNERLSYSLDYLHTLGEHARHRSSVRIERMIILLIFLELCVGLTELCHRYAEYAIGSGEGGSHSRISDCS